jgi:hypothetical protein
MALPEALSVDSFQDRIPLMSLHRKHEYFWQQSYMKLVAYPQGEPQNSLAWAE